jgi:hypothetical protein
MAQPLLHHPLWICGRVLTDRSTPFGPYGQTVDKWFPPTHRLTTLVDLATTTPQFQQQICRI